MFELEAPFYLLFGCLYTSWSCGGREVRSFCAAECETDLLELCTRSTSLNIRVFLNVREVSNTVFKKLFIDVVGVQADHKLVFEAIVELVAKAAVNGSVA